MRGGLWDAIIDGLGNLVGFIVITPLAATGEALRRVNGRTKKNKERSKDNRARSKGNESRLDAVEDTVEGHAELLKSQTLRLTGDDDDPNNPGLLETVHRMDQKTEKMDKKVDRVGKKVDGMDEKLDELVNEIDK